MPWRRVARYQTRYRASRPTSPSKRLRSAVVARARWAIEACALLESNAPQKLLLLIAIERLIDPDRVFALDAVTGMEHALGPVAVVGEQEQPLGFPIQPAHRIQPRAFCTKLMRNKIEHRLPCVPVRHRAGDAGWLVHHDVKPLLPLFRYRHAVDGEDVARRVDRLADARQGAVHGDTTGRDQILGLPARGNTGIGERLLNTNPVVTH